MQNRTLKRRFTLILAAYAMVVLILWAVFHNTVFSTIRQTAREAIAQTENSLQSNLGDELSRLKLISSSLAGSTYVRDFLSEPEVAAYYEKAEAVSEIIRKSTYPHVNADSIVTFTAQGAAFRFTGGVSNAAVEQLYSRVIEAGAPAWSVVELDGTGYLCLVTQVGSNGTGTPGPAGYVVTLSNLAKMRRMLMALDTMTGIETAVILDGVILLSSAPALEGQAAAELERRYGSVTVSQVAGTNLFAATAITKAALHHGERLFLIVSAAMILALVAAILLLYRVLSARMVSPILERTATMQMGLLKTQINAHFVINTIICIESLSEQGESKKAAAAARNLAGMLRTLHESDDEPNIYDQVVDLERYIEIMNIRGNDRFSVQIEPDDRLVEYRMMGQVLQPLAENALTHGLGNKAGNCSLVITGRLEKDCVCFEVSDNGAGMAPEGIKTLQEALDAAGEWAYDEHQIKGIALINIQKRIRARYGAGYGLAVRGEAGQGFTVTVRLPIIKDM